MNKTKGFTLVEVVVTMVLVVMLSIVAFTTLSFSTSYNAKSKVKNFFITQTENFAKAYLLGEEDYQTSIKLLTGNDSSFGDYILIKYSQNFEVTQNDDYAYIVNLNFEADKLKIDCLRKNGSQIYFKEVPKNA